MIGGFWKMDPEPLAGSGAFSGTFHRAFSIGRYSRHIKLKKSFLSSVLTRHFLHWWCVDNVLWLFPFCVVLSPFLLFFTWFLDKFECLLWACWLDVVIHIDLPNSSRWISPNFWIEVNHTLSQSSNLSAQCNPNCLDTTLKPEFYIRQMTLNKYSF